jgi:NADPH-dependent 2,4-dienoyl-CoA reductase/sulfur reductase-like enzyme
MPESTTVIVGASIGGVRTAQALRSEGYPGAIILIGAEGELPYDKPPLSKSILAGDSTMAEITLLTTEQARELDLELRLGQPAIRLSTANQDVELADGTRVAFDNLVLATGARARPSPWGTPNGLHVIRTAADARALRRHFGTTDHLVIIGGGFIGAETAATAVELGMRVTLVDPEPVPMARVMGAEIGELFIDLHRRRGVDTRFGVGVESVHGEHRSFAIGLSDGSTLAADTVVVGIGAIPNDDWLESSGLEVSNGVVCDVYCRAIGHDNIYAVGDVCRFDNTRRGGSTRLEHWTNAVEQAVVVARNIARPDEKIRHEPVEYVWSDQYDWKIQTVGLAGSSTHTVIGEVTNKARFAVCYPDENGRLTGVVVVNWPKALVTARKAIALGAEYAEFTARLETMTVSARTTVKETT